MIQPYHRIRDVLRAWVILYLIINTLVTQDCLVCFPLHLLWNLVSVSPCCAILSLQYLDHPPRCLNVLPMLGNKSVRLYSFTGLYTPRIFPLSTSHMPHIDFLHEFLRLDQLLILVRHNRHCKIYTPGSCVQTICILELF